MKITREASYAIQAMIYLAGHPLDRRVPTANISEAEDMPLPFLTKVISRLATAGLVITSRGMGGGVSLTRPPEEISLLQVIEATDGPIMLNPCLRHPGMCECEPYCAAHDVWADIQANFIQDLDAVTMKELARRQAEY